MLRKIALAAIVAFAAAPLAGLAARPAAADDARAAKALVHVAVYDRVYHQHRHGRSHRFRHRHARGHFLARVRRGDVVCFRARAPYGWHRFGGHGYRFHRWHGHRLGYGAVRYLIRHGHGGELRCFARY